MFSMLNALTKLNIVPTLNFVGMKQAPMTKHGITEKTFYTVKIVLTTTRIERPLIFNDHFETLPTIFTIICH